MLSGFHRASSDTALCLGFFSGATASLSDENEQRKRLCGAMLSVKAGTGRCSVLSCRGETFPETLFKTRVLGLDKLAALHPDPDTHILTLDKNIPAAILDILDYNRGMQTRADALTVGKHQGVKIFCTRFTSIWSVWNPGMDYANRSVCEVMSEKTARREGGTN